MKISLVINTFNRIASLPNTLEALTFLRYPDLEVVVVNGPSTDGTDEYLRANWADRIKLCDCAEPNLSKSRNIGIQNASGDVVCFIDDDGVPEPDWLDELVKAYQDERVAAAGGWVRDHSGVNYQSKYIVSSRSGDSDCGIDDPLAVPEASIHAESFPGLIGVNSSFRRSHLLEVGGFDEIYAYFLDETDVLARLVDAGYKVAMVPSAQVHHKYAPSHIRQPNGIAKSWLQVMTSKAYFAIKNAVPSRSLADCLANIETHKQELRGHTNWFIEAGLIDQRTYDRLMSEIEVGAATGIRQAFAVPERALIGAHEVPEWKSFPRPRLEKRSRIALVTGLYPPRPCGGVAVFMNTLAQELAAEGHEVTVITHSEHDAPHTVDFEGGVWVHRIPSTDCLEPTYPAGMPGLPSSIAAFAGRVLTELDRINTHRKFDCVIGSIWDLELAAVIASRRYRTAMYLVTSYKLMESSKPEWLSNAHFYQEHVLKMIRGEVWAIENCDTVIGSTECIVEDIEAAYDISIPRRRLKLIPFGVPDVASANAVAEVRNQQKLLFVGRLEERKGVRALLEALPAIMSGNPAAVFDIVGDDRIVDQDGTTFRARFEALHGSASWSSRVRFHGHVSDAELMEFYENCSLFIAPSRYESFGLMYVEAMRFAKPCIGCNVGGIKEVVDHQVTGLLVEPDHAGQLADAVNSLLRDPKRRLAMGRAGRRRFEQRYASDVFASKIVSFVCGKPDQTVSLARESSVLAA